MASVTRQPDTISVDELPIDVELFEDTVTVTQLMQLSTSTRDEIDARTNELVSHIRELLTEPVWEGDSEAMRLFRQSYRHLELSSRPTPHTITFTAFSYMQETATLTHDLLRVYRDKTRTGTK
ncbi:hypothetical protein AQI88_28285 [Streptomyces cellostaticus]|uniref:Uncharacterized protein n=1 Tax=Streptomyces cellostaticus TaxID=67285 RepID=A0A101NGX6_9ACTN|nr:hypothetical protein [Streptomyces cellostaticus]KUM93026.1 hypothetical protein AQI88_28285 [Streptomyces cellostaticus]GHI06045.1 hypothetical protein Scel_43660 [Streptomyces cellostaticus]